MKSFFGSLFLLAAATFAHVQAPAAVSSSAAPSSAAVSSSALEQPELQQCERFWNCEADGTFFETRAACRASCSSTCELIDYGC
jgi:hypothetical protein